MKDAAGQELSVSTPFGTYLGQISVKLDDVNADGVQDLIVAAGLGGGPRIVILDGASGYQTVLADFMAFDEPFRGGVAIATGDVNGDGIRDLVVGAGPGGGPHVKIFSYSQGTIVTIGEFMAYDIGFDGGVNVAVADVSGDGVADIVVGAGRGGGAHVKFIDGRSQALFREFFAFDASLRAGVNLAAGDVTGDGIADLIVSPEFGAGPVVRVFRVSDLTVQSEFFAYEAEFTGGVNVGVGRVPGGNQIVVRTGPGPTGGARLRGFDGLAGLPVFDDYLADANLPLGATVS
jgi:hypothetical protein